MSLVDEWKPLPWKLESSLQIEPAQGHCQDLFASVPCVSSIVKCQSVMMCITECCTSLVYFDLLEMFENCLVNQPLLILMDPFIELPGYKSGSLSSS